VNPWSDATPVRLGEYALARGEGRLSALGLGSCVAVILYEPDAKVGALAHVVLPSDDAGRSRGPSAKYAPAAVALLMSEMRKAGADPAKMTARLVGGACMFASLVPPGSVHVGQRNVESCRTALQTAGVRTVSEDVGAEYGRSVVIDVADGSVLVRSVGRGEKRV